MSLTLWLPGTVAGAYVCRAIIDGQTGETCGQSFDDAASLQKHAIKCASAHIDEIRLASPIHKARGTVLDEDQWDPEVQRHMLRVGERMVKTGDYTIKPRERAGF